jgi:cardiolipin synthase
MNFDNRSLAFNNESNLMVLDKRFGAEMDSTFYADLSHSVEITREQFQRRGLWERTLESVAVALSRLL